MLIGNNFKVKEDIKAINGSVIKKGTFVKQNNYAGFVIDVVENKVSVLFNTDNKNVFIYPLDRICEYIEIIDRSEYEKLSKLEINL